MKRGPLIALAATGAALVIAAGVMVFALTRPESADAVAERYLQALATGDVDAVAALLAEPDETVLAAFAAADAYLADPVVTDAVAGEVGTGFRAEAALDGADTTVLFTLTDESGTWTVTDSLATIDVATTLGDAVSIGDAVLPLGEEGVVSVLPAVYTLQAAPTDFLDGAATVAATNAQPLSAAIDASLSPDAAARAQPQLDAYADACVAPAETLPDRCGLQVPWPADLTALDTLTTRIDTYPVLQIDDAALTFTASGGSVVVTAAGTDREGTADSVTYRTDDWTLRGTVSFAGDELVLTVF
ncbi:hypothetical protein H9651_04440 [Microbacterium sp. Sa4CUA7]|uniref:NTF2-like N-terminal transpeptidase domain-containing protein n=1 Tax=Microbacterium pullorum TaxID=2762236 RepID=A0ABR8S062_9MICO|nr:hypothetical protein [Microbacterium pullorum]MBD7956875.1 hypothetical protein [Microbacterium pullorum]